MATPAGCRTAAIDLVWGWGYAEEGFAPRGFVRLRTPPHPISTARRRQAIEKEEPIQLEGTISEVLGNANFRVQVAENHSVLAKIAGKMRRHRIRVLPGDRVKVEVTPYDLERGRIVYRYRN